MMSRATLFASLLALSLSGFMWLTNFKGAAAVGTSVQLVRLSVTSDGGLVRIEIVADGSLDAATIDRFSRASQTVFRVHGARSLLRQSYEVNDSVAREVRTVAGESNGEPYVDVIIALGDRATVAQKKNFNRLVIGVDADLARLRQRAPEATGVAKARPKPAKPQAVAAAQPSARMNDIVTTDTLPTLTASVPQAVPQTVAQALPQTVFRGRTIWSTPPTRSYDFSRSNMASYLPMFFAQQNGAGTVAPVTPLRFAHMVTVPPGAKIGVWIPGTTAAERDTVGGHQWGSGYVRPSLLLGGTYDDNFYYRSGTGRNLGVFTVAPRLEYELPGVTRALRLAYEGRFRRLTNGQWANGHTVDLDGRIDVTSYMRLAVRDHFIRSALDPREYDPAGEVYIVGDTFYRNDAGLRAEFQLNPRSRLALDGGYNLVRWSEDHIAGAPLFINYEEGSAGGTFERDISEETTAFATFTYTSSDSGVPLRPQFNNLHNYRRFDFELGARTQVTDTSGLAVKAGFERLYFLNAGEVNDFSGLVFDLRFRRDLTPKTNFELAALRKTQVSIFNLEGGNTRLLSTGGSARIENAPTENLKLALGVNYQQLGFPVAVVPTTTASGGIFVGQFAGERRKDHLYGFSFETGYRWSDLVKTRFIYSFSRRDSTIPVFTFNRNRLSLVFEIGRRNDVKGRPF